MFGKFNLNFLISIFHFDLIVFFEQFFSNIIINQKIFDMEKKKTKTKNKKQKTKTKNKKQKINIIFHLKLIYLFDDKNFFFVQT